MTQAEQLRGFAVALECLGDAMVLLFESENEEIQRLVDRARKHIGRATEDLVEAIHTGAESA